jgi:hypothetical protein
MDPSIRLRRPDEVPPEQPRRKLISLPARSAGANAFAMRRAILQCATEAGAAEPRDREARVYSFLARLSATMEGLGETELDSALWDLMETKSISQERA